jgi:branched-chain amino acid transport system ATP-binding protein
LEALEMLEIENLSVIRRGRAILDSVSLTAAGGEILLIAGHNGAGKSTLLKTIFGDMTPSQGTVRGVETASSFYLPQGTTIFPSLRVSEHLTLYRSLNTDSALTDASLSEGILPGDTLAGELSGGERQWLAASRLHMSKPRLILIDELTTGLSASWRGRLLEQLRVTTDSTGASTLLVEHNVREAMAIADRLLVLRQGKLVLDAPAARFVQDPAELEKALLL